MARMIPANLSHKTESKAEEKVFNALRNSLDDSHTVFHSFDLPARNLQNKLIDSEIDFLIFQQKQGLLALEVKGGRIAYDGKQWLQNSKPLKESPYYQAKKNKYAISNYLERKIGKIPPLSLGHAVCFPDIFTTMTDLPVEADPNITITGNLVNHLEKVIPDIFKNYQKDKHNPLNIQESEALRKALMPVFEYGRSLVDMIGAAEQKIFTLTEEQCNYLDFIGDRKRVLVKGCAGSGKTVLALKKAQGLALDGKKVLLLCYNVPLGQLLRKSTKDIEGNITAINYHSFCFQELKEAGIELTPRSDNEFWRTEVPDRFDQLLAEHPLKYDAIIVDEGQDFIDSYWITIDQMLASDGHFYIFYDPDQNLFGSELQFPISDEPFILKTNCRNTRQICAALTKHTDQEMKLKEDTPEGKQIEEIHCSSDHESRKELSRILHKLVNEEKISPDRIVILGGHSIDNTCLKDNHNVGNFTIEREPEEGSNTIRYYTYMRFKGCEADAVILLDVDPKDDRWSNKSALYTAISRAKFLLYVLYKKSESQ